MPNDYPWYEIVNGSGLAQGDILFGCPVVEVAPEVTFPLPEGDLSVTVDSFDVIVLTQSCDLVNNNADSVILCPHWSIKDATKFDAKLGQRDTQKNIIQGRRPRYHMLEAEENDQRNMSHRIVDLSRVFRLPTDFVNQLALSQNPRLRLRSPYKEHLSQAFARFFMRVGLPQDIRLP